MKIFIVSKFHNFFIAITVGILSHITSVIFVYFISCAAYYICGLMIICVIIYIFIVSRLRESVLEHAITM